MPQYDEPLEMLRLRSPQLSPPADLWPFWEQTLSDSRGVKQPTKVAAVESRLRLVDVFDLEFSGSGGSPVRAWMRRPAGLRGPLPTVVRFCGYGGGRGLPHQDVIWPLLGYAEVLVDTRGQGGLNGYAGDTADPYGSGVSHPGFMTRGIQSKDDYYFRRVFADAALAIEAVADLPGVDSSQIAVSGTSQGGGIALAAGALTDLVSAAMINVPFLCDFPRALALASEGPYLEITGYLKTHRRAVDETMRVLAYFDAALLVAKSEAPALFSVALADTICPPSSVFAAINNYAGAVETRVYPFNNHEGGQFHQEEEELRWLTNQFSSQ